MNDQKKFNKESGEFKTIALFGLGGIVFLEGVALWKGVDGAMFGAAMAAIGGLMGWVVKHFQTKWRKRK